MRIKKVRKLIMIKKLYLTDPTDQKSTDIIKQMAYDVKKALEVLTNENDETISD